MTSESQVRFVMQKHKAMARAAFAAGRESSAHDTATAFGVWWNDYVILISERFQANEISYLGRDINTFIPQLMMEVADTEKTRSSESTRGLK